MVARGCVTRVVVLVIVGGALVAAWRWGGALLPQQWQEWTEGWPGVASPPPSPSAGDAAAAVARYEALVEGEAGGEVRLSALEVTGALRYRVPREVPEALHQPFVRFRDEEVRIGGRVPRAELPNLPGPERFLAVLPDTLDLLLEGPLVPLDGGEVAMVVQRIRASGIPLPARARQSVLEILGRPGRRDLPSHVLPLRLPPGVTRAFVEGDALVLGNGG